MANPSDTTDFFNGFVDNIYTVINTYKSYIGFQKLLKTDDSYISIFPAITIELDSVIEEWDKMPRIKTIIATYNITYYYQQYSESVLRNDMRLGLNKIANVLRENWNLNGYTQDKGSTVNTVTPYIIENGENVVAGGVIELECRKNVDVTIVASP